MVDGDLLHLLYVLQQYVVVDRWNRVPYLRRVCWSDDGGMVDCGGGEITAAHSSGADVGFVKYLFQFQILM